MYAWITRAQPGAEATAARLRALGWSPVIAPLLETRFPAATIDLSGVAALAFTSANGARAVAGLCPGRDLPVFAVGAATAAAARDLGFARVLAADGGVAALALLIGDHAPIQGGVVLHAAAAQPAGDLVGALQAMGVAARAQAVYETVALEPPAGFLERLTAIEAVLVHSPRAGRRLACVLHGVPARGLVAYCLSAEVLASLESLDLAGKFAAALPNENALLSLLADHRSTPRKAT